MPLVRYGAGELYGFDCFSLSPGELQRLAQANHRDMPCPFKPVSPGESPARCHKKGGVCSLRRYARTNEGTVVSERQPVITCPSRFLQGDEIVRWVGEVLIGTESPLVISELPFLMGEIETEEAQDQDAVGKIDKVLVNPDQGGALRWCALEFQAVYFSGRSMENDFKLMRGWTGPGLPFPNVQRRPDFRSSGPKRLMPQLQIKVPTISRWGKKVAVVIDEAFWDSLGEMREVKDLSNCDIAWFVVSYGPSTSGRFSLRRHSTHFTILEDAVRGLTGGTPMSLGRFESQILARLSPS